MKQFRCRRCHKTFEADKKYKSNAGTDKICPKCRKPRCSNKGKKIMSPYKRLGI